MACPGDNGAQIGTIQPVLEIGTHTQGPGHIQDKEVTQDTKPAYTVLLRNLLSIPPSLCQLLSRAASQETEPIEPAPKSAHRHAPTNCLLQLSIASCSAGESVLPPLWGSITINTTT